MENIILGRTLYEDDFKTDEPEDAGCTHAPLEDAGCTFLKEIYLSGEFNHLELFSEAYNKIKLDDYYKIKNFLIEKKVSLSYHPWLDISTFTFSDKVINLKQIIRDCEKIGMKYCVLHLGSFEGDKYECLQNLVEVFGEILDNFSTVKVCLENVPLICEWDDKTMLGSAIEDFDYIFSKINSENLGMNIDVGHCNLTSNNFSDLVGNFSEKIFSAHLSDNNGIKDEHIALGKGNIKWEEIFKVFKDMNFKGPFVLELKEEYIKESYNFLKQFI
ncbi:MAG: sugar phosphate isomerase/epimerase family protein [Candidatus Firestonebacteria bacterium]